MKSDKMTTGICFINKTNHESRLKINPQNYFHDVVNDIIGMINSYVISPQIAALTNELIYQAISPRYCLKYVDVDRLTYDLHYFIYLYLGIGPTNWWEVRGRVNTQRQDRKRMPWDNPIGQLLGKFNDILVSERCECLFFQIIDTFLAGQSGNI